MRLFDALVTLGNFVGDIHKEVIKNGQDSLDNNDYTKTTVSLTTSSDLLEIQKHLNSSMRILLSYPIFANLNVPDLTDDDQQSQLLPSQN